MMTVMVDSYDYVSKLSDNDIDDDDSWWSMVMMLIDMTVISLNTRKTSLCILQ